MRPTLPITLTLAALALIGCGKPEETALGSTTNPKTQLATSMADVEVKPGDEASLLPIKQGARWTFATEEAVAGPGGQVRNTSDVIFEMSKVEPWGGGQKVTIEMTTGGKVSNRQIWGINKEGIFLLATGLKLNALTPPQPICRFPVKTGDKYTWSGKGKIGDNVADMTTQYEVKGNRIVDTEQGQTKALMIESATILKSKGTVGESRLAVWIRPGSGVVRLSEVTKFGNILRSAKLRLKSTSGL
jgi:hypothetical protein